MPNSLRCPAGPRCASVAVRRGIIGHPGLKTEALRRFDRDGFLGIGLKTAIFARIDGKSMQSRQNGFPVGT